MSERILVKKKKRGGGQSEGCTVSDKENKKKNRFISFILKRRSKIILETGSIIRLLGQTNSYPAEFPGVGDKG